MCLRISNNVEDVLLRKPVIMIYKTLTDNAKGINTSKRGKFASVQKNADIRK